MLYSIFSKSKPINFVILSSLLFILFAANNALLQTATRIWVLLVGLLVLLFGVFLVDFICKKNNLTKNNTLAPLLFILFIASFPHIFIDIKAMISGILVLIAIRRMISLRTQNNIVQKVFDASFWILVASLFNEWALLFFAALYGIVLIYKISDLRSFLTPLVACIVVGILCFTYAYALDKMYLFEEVFQFSIDRGFLQSVQTSQIVTMGILTLITAVAVLYYFIKTQKQKGVKRETSFSVLLLLLISLIVTVLGTKENSRSLVFMAFPASVVYANLLQRLPKRWMQEALIIVSMTVPVTMLVLQFASIG